MNIFRKKSVEPEVRVLETGLEPASGEVEPDWGSRPLDSISYCFGYACPNEHISDDEFIEVVSSDKESIRICTQCGALTKLAKVLLACGHKWELEPVWLCNPYIARSFWRTYKVKSFVEFVTFPKPKTTKKR